MAEESKPWYENGLSFQCTGCGKCCTGKPGYVWVSEEEIAEMADFLKISVKDFLQRYVRKAHNRLALVEYRKNYDCVFLKDRKCLVYGARPTQCRTFPWWPQNLSSKKAWEETALECEGIRESAPIVPCSTIEEQLLIQIKRNNEQK